MSLNKLTNTTIGQDINLNIGCTELKADIINSTDIKTADVTITGDCIVGANNFNITNGTGTTGYVLSTDGAGNLSWAPDNTGGSDVAFTGGAPTVVGELPIFNSTNGREIKESGTLLNDVLNDISNNTTVVNTKVSKTGDSMSGALLHSAGTVGAPSISFGSETGTGLYRPVAGTIGVSVLGTEEYRISATELDVKNNNITNCSRLFVADGTAGNPPIAFSDPDSGLSYNSATNKIQLGTSGNIRLAVDDTKTEVLGNLRIPDGTAANPSLSFTSAPTAGLSWAGSFLAFSTSGTQRMAVTDSAVVYNKPATAVRLGNPATPEYTYFFNPNTGVYSPAVDKVGFTTAGVARLLAENDRITVTAPVRVNGGTAGAPAHSFNADGTSGLYQSAVSQLQLSTAGVERVLINTARIECKLPIRLNSYTVAGLPAVGTAGQVVYCSNLMIQPAPVYSDGTSWRRFSDNTIAT